MIRIDNNMKAQSQKRFDDVCMKVDNKIKEAVKNNKTSCYFTCDKDGDADVYERVYEVYKNEGYYIYPTGNIGGVWQLTENISW